MPRRLLYILCILAAIMAVGSSPWSQETPVAIAADIQVSHDQFAAYIDELSEPEGYFDTDNFISNETSYLHVIDDLRRQTRPGGVYMGVGPDQNFSYIVHTQPSLAVIVDIRRQNMLQHLLYKALFDLSATRAEFLARLFSRDVPAVGAASGLRDILRAVRAAGSSEALYQANLAAVRDRLSGTYGLKLTAEDFDKIEYVYRTLHEQGMDLRFSSIGRNNALNYPTFESLMLQTDRAGNLQGYLSTEELFLWMKKFQSENRLIPIVGDFAGPTALKATAAFLKRNELQVTAFYTSNVEYYVFGDGAQWRSYVENVQALPMASDAVFVRAYFDNAAGGHPLNVPGHRSTTLVQSVADFLRDHAAGRLTSYRDVVMP